MYRNCCKQKIENHKKITLARSNYWMLKCALTLKDQQTAVQPCLPQGTVYCKNNDNDNDDDDDDDDDDDGKGKVSN